MPQLSGDYGAAFSASGSLTTGNMGYAYGHWRLIHLIDLRHPDFVNTPASCRRPPYAYAPRDYTAPIVSIITPYYNTGPVFSETARSVQRMSLPYWEWLL